MSLDISPNWLNIVRRLQAEASRSNSAGVLTVQIILDPSGVPVYWTEPQLRKIEPRSRAREFLSFLTET